MTTLQKLALARLASRVLIAARRSVGLKSHAICDRGGIRWSLDLAQGFDLSIFLFGAFEAGVIAACRRLCPYGGVVLDIGANMGALTLPLANMVGMDGKVHAFEPTDYAFRKLAQNIALNPQLAPRIEAAQVFLGDGRPSSVPDAIPSSWPLGREQGLDPMHGGRPEALSGARHETLDAWMARINSPRIDLVKLDVDGHELDVLHGAEELLKAHKPTLIVEFAPYVFEGKSEGFDELVYFFKDRNYAATFLSGKHLPLDANLKTLIPRGAGLNAVLTPR